MMGARKDLKRLKLRLFGSGNTECMNVSTYDKTNSILGGHENRIDRLEERFNELISDVNALVEKSKPKSKKKSKVKRK